MPHARRAPSSFARIRGTWESLIPGAPIFPRHPVGAGQVGVHRLEVRAPAFLSISGTWKTLVLNADTSPSSAVVGAACTVRHPFIVRIRGILDCWSDLGIPVNLGRAGRPCFERVHAFGFWFRPSVGFRVWNSSIGELSGSGSVHRRIPGSAFVHSKAKTSSGCPKPEPSFPGWTKSEPMLAGMAITRTFAVSDGNNPNPRFSNK